VETVDREENLIRSPSYPPRFYRPVCPWRSWWRGTTRCRRVSTFKSDRSHQKSAAKMLLMLFTPLEVKRKGNNTQLLCFSLALKDQLRPPRYRLTRMESSNTLSSFYYSKLLPRDVLSTGSVEKSFGQHDCHLVSSEVLTCFLDQWIRSQM